MRIDDFIWLDQFVEKLETKHGVYPDEVEEVFLNRPLIRKVQKGRVSGEDLYRVFGQTTEGRYLTMIFVYKPTLSICKEITPTFTLHNVGDVWLKSRIS